MLSGQVRKQVDINIGSQVSEKAGQKDLYFYWPSLILLTFAKLASGKY
jgi:hypothetical protein